MGLVYHSSDIWEILCFFGRLIGTCAVFYGFFLTGKLGAGDIKLMAVCVAVLGVWKGILVLFAGMVLALSRTWMFSMIRSRRYLPMKNQELKLAPYIFAGYCLSWVSGII